MKMTFRWFGEKSDPIPLAYIRQIPGCTGLMGVLDHYAAGEVWDEDEIRDYVRLVNAAGLEVKVIESVNVHEEIKLGSPERDRYIDNYIMTVRRLAGHGVDTIIYNFMPVFDWLRTDLNRRIPEDGSFSMYYDEAELAGLTPQQLAVRTNGSANGYSLPGWEPERLEQLNQILDRYRGFTVDDLRGSLRYFLDAVCPVCEELGVRLAIHPDDPAWPLFGLPRLARSGDDLNRILALHDSPANAVCFCTGSLGSDPANDLPAIAAELGKKNRIACAHIRNLKYLGYHRFRECSHLSADGSLDLFGVLAALHDTCPDVTIRPDHGRAIWGEKGRPGYGLYDRALGIAYINGIWEALSRKD